MIAVDGETMLKIAPKYSEANKYHKPQKDIIDAVGPLLQSILAEYEITTPLRIAHFLAQTCHESGGFRTTEEVASGEAYEGRKNLGNTEPGDGPRYKGRGLIQLTGRYNYKLFTKPDLDLVNHPELAADPKISLRLACDFWKSRKINSACDRDDVVAVTASVNGGDNGLNDRRELTDKAKKVLGIEGTQTSGAAPAKGHPTLRRGDKGDEVKQLQTALKKHGYEVGVDGDFGPGTEAAVSRLQSDHKIVADGIAGPATWALLDA